MRLASVPKLCAWSYAHHQAKPGTFLYEWVLRETSRQHVVLAPREVLFVGNDMLKDIWPAGRIGFRTALVRWGCPQLSSPDR